MAVGVERVEERVTSSIPALNMEGPTWPLCGVSFCVEQISDASGVDFNSSMAVFKGLVS